MIARPTTVLLAACLLTSLAGCRRADGPPPLCVLKLECPRPELIDADDKMLCKFEVRDGAEGTVYNQSAGVEKRKNPELGFLKPSYGLELRTASDAETSANLLGMGADGDWILDGLPNDRSLMRDALVADSFRQLGGIRYAPEGRFCTLDLNGEPQGVYRLVEKIKRDDDRVNIAADNGSGRSFIVRQDNDGTLGLSIGLEEMWQLVYPGAPTDMQSVEVQSWLDGLSAALMSDSPDDPASGIFASLDLDATVDWILLEELSKNIDAYNRGIYFVRDSGRKARIVPSGTDLSFGQPTVVGDTSDPKNDSPDGWITQRPTFIQVVGGVAALKSRLGPRWRALRAGPWSTAAILGRLDGYGVTLTPAAIAQNVALWSLQPTSRDAGTDAASADAASADAASTEHAASTDDASADDASADDAGADDAGADDSSTDDVGADAMTADTASPADAGTDAPNPDATADRPEYSFYPVADYADEVAKLRAFIESRLAWIDAHIDSYPN